MHRDNSKGGRGLGRGGGGGGQVTTHHQSVVCGQTVISGVAPLSGTLSQVNNAPWHQNIFKHMLSYDDANQAGNDAAASPTATEASRR